MAEGSRKDDWERHSHLLSLIANCHRDPKKCPPFTPRMFDPFAQLKSRPSPPKTKDLSILKTLFVTR